MTDSINYGTTFFNGYAIVKKVCTLNHTERTELAQEFPGVTFSTAYSKSGSQRLFKIQAILPSMVYDRFAPALRLAMLRTKQQDLQDAIDITQSCINATAEYQQSCMTDEDPRPF